ncbi:MAG: HYR domain-containing protein [Phaeodactylibacter sp.]|nr:HYR domain-containing protein [Phaeodactylibacter sp.]
MKKLTFSRGAFALLALAYFLWLGHSVDLSNGLTGAPNEGSCMDCHSNATATADLELTGLPGTLVPNENYTLTVHLDQTAGMVLNNGGFELVALDANGNNAGNLSESSPELVTSVDPDNGREYVKHAFPQSSPNGNNSWTFNWKSPASLPGNGQVHFFLGACLGNLNGNPTGDFCLEEHYTTGFPTGTLNVSIQTVSEISCAGASDGALIAQASGGAGPYNFQWSNGAVGNVNNNLPTGQYTVQVMDATGNVAIATQPLHEPTPIFLLQNAQVNVECANMSDGMLGVAATGGTPPYTFEWSNGATGAVAANLPAGDYSVTLTDAHDCEASLNMSVEVLDNQQPTATGPIVLDFDWEGNPIFIDPYLEDFFVDNCGISSIEPSQSVFTCLDGGTHTIQIMVIDENNNVAIFIGVINLNDVNPPEFTTCPSVITAEGCNNAVTYQVAATDDCNIVNLDLTEGLPSGSNFPLGTTDVVVTATDFAGNEATCSFVVNIVDETAPVFATCPSSTTIDFCDDVFEYTVLATDNCQEVNYVLTQGLPSGSVFPPGTTHVFVDAVDGSGNTSTCSFAVQVAPSWSLGILDMGEPCFGEDNGFIRLNLTGNLNEFTINWSPIPSNDVEIDNLPPGVYEAEVVGPNGCVQTIQVELDELPEIQMVVDTVIHDMSNTSSGRILISFSGAATPLTISWYLDGTFYSEAEDLFNVPAGTYSVVLEDNNGCIQTIEGIVVESTTGTRQEQVVDYQVFPNPTNGQFKVLMAADQLAESTILLYDSQGREVPVQIVLDGDYAMIEIPAAAPAGLYFLRINGLDFKVAERMLLVR